MWRFKSRIGFLPTLVAASLIASQSFAQANLLSNPGFETGGGSYSGWFTFGSGPHLSLPSGDNIIRTGVAAAKIYGEFNGCPSSPSFGTGGFGQSFTPTAGLVYTFSGYSFVSTADPIPGTDTCNKNRCIAKVVYFNAATGGSEIQSNEVVIGDGNSVLNQWNAFSVSAPAPTGALRVEALILFLQPACDGGSVYVDDTSLITQSPDAGANVLTNPSFNTNLSGWTTFGNAYQENRSYLVRSTPGSAKLFSTFVGGSDSGMYQSFAASAGSKWVLGVYSLDTCRENPISGTNDNLAIANIVFRDAGNTVVGSTQTVITDHTAPLGTWSLHVVRATAPAATVTAQAYILFVSPSLLGGAVWVDDVVFRQSGPTDVSPLPGRTAFALHQNVPNPFNPTTRIDFELAHGSRVDLSIYDLAGRLVSTLVQGDLDAGTHVVNWNGRDANGNAVAAGVYRYVLRTPAGRTSRSMVLIQ